MCQLSLIATEPVPKVLGCRGTPLGIWSLLGATAIATGAGRATVSHLRILILGGRLSWGAAIAAWLTRELAWGLLVSHRSS